ncbi:MAG TPA: hypothetical protein VGT99_12855 [Gammaproteobacteria bacterium]|nr:hypothetical protein [Gammaproteobacteria bacterium]
MRTLILIAALGLPAAALADGDSFSISADQWALPRSGAALLHLAPFSAAVQDWVAHPGAHIVIVHAGSDQGNLWAGELSDWLVALGVPAEQIDRRVSADQGEDSITLLVER